MVSNVFAALHTTTEKKTKHHSNLFALPKSQHGKTLVSLCSMVHYTQNAIAKANKDRAVSSTIRKTLNRERTLLPRRPPNRALPPAHRPVSKALSNPLKNIQISVRRLIWIILHTATLRAHITGSNFDFAFFFCVFLTWMCFFICVCSFILLWRLTGWSQRWLCLRFVLTFWADGYITRRTTVKASDACRVILCDAV